LDALPPSDILVQLTGWRANSKLLPSGLLGPVSLESIGP
ncbi:MAG: hypothetical protein JWP73_2896, partial [Phenylobacterium sp.]|nr:hypothetical protein [Phenylobacterium sp.]